MTRPEMLALLSSWLSGDRLSHSLESEAMARSLAIAHGEDPQRAATAALLHDLCRCKSEGWQLAYLARQSQPLSEEWRHSPQLWHGLCASVYLRRELGVRDKGILDAVRYHTTGRPGMRALEKIVYLADKAEASRDYPKADELRALAYRSLDEAMRFAQREILAWQCKKGYPLVKEAITAYNYYQKG